MAIQKKPATRVSTAEIMQAKAQMLEEQGAAEQLAQTSVKAKPALTQISAKIPTEIHRQVRIKCLQDGVEMQNVIAELLADWIRK